MPAKSADATSMIIAAVMEPADANYMGNVHGGAIMKQIDTAAGVVATRHAGRQAVTASIDRLDFLGPIHVGDLLILKARLNLVGRTSMEVGVRVEAENLATGANRHCASAYLTYVALGADGRPAEVPALLLDGPDDLRRNREAQDRRRMRLLEKHRERGGPPPSAGG